MAVGGPDLVAEVVTECGRIIGTVLLPYGCRKTATGLAVTHLLKIVFERSRPSTDRADTVGVADVHRVL